MCTFGKISPYEKITTISVNYLIDLYAIITVMQKAFIMNANLSFINFYSKGTKSSVFISSK